MITMVHWKINTMKTFTIAGIFLIITVLNFGCSSSSEKIPEGFQIHPDFNLEMVASEPLVFDPVEMKFDEKGRAYVLEMPGYPKSDIPSRLIHLLDEDKDGIYDTREVFSADLGVATSFMPYKDGFLVASPPHLLYIADIEGNGKEDQRKILMNGFSVDNLQHNFNGLTYGLDNWVYVANGGNSGKPFFADRPESALDLRRMDLRMDLENEEMVRIGKSSGGFKITFDDWGRLYETHNTNHISHLVFEDRYTEGLPVTPNSTLSNISDHEEYGTSRIYPIGQQESRLNHPEQSGYFSGACGITHYGGGSFPEKFDNTVLVADCVVNLIHMDRLISDGTSFISRRMQDKKEFLASADRSFRPVNMEVGPDGALYVLDMHRTVIEHPEWIPDELEVKMDLDAGKEKGRIYKISPKNKKLLPFPVFDIENSETLVEAFSSSNQWTRMTAQRLLVMNDKQEAIPLLVKILETSTNPLARLHALWTLDGLRALDPPVLLKVLQDEADEVVENAIKIVEKTINEDKSIFEQVLKFTESTKGRVKMQAVLALSTLEDENYGIHRQVIGQKMAALLSAPERDVWFNQAISAVLRRQALDFSLKTISDIESNDLNVNQQEVFETLLTFIGKKGDAQETDLVLENLANSSKSLKIKTHALGALFEGWKQAPNNKIDRKTKSELTSHLRNLEKPKDLALLRASGDLRKVLALSGSTQIFEMIAEASAAISDQNLPIEQRLEWLQLAGLGPIEQRKELLLKLLGNREPMVLQNEAIVQLSNATDAQIANRLIELWPGLVPQARQKISDILLYKPMNHDVLLSAIEDGKINPGELNLNLERRRVLLRYGTDDIRKRAEALFSDAGVVKRKDAIEAMKPVLALNGDESAGKMIFESVCAQCHRYGSIGKEVGPSLTEINRKSKESLLYDILDPNAAVDAEYLNYQVRTKDGSIFTGLIANESDTEITLKMTGGLDKKINKNEMESMSSTGSSMMFEGLEANMNHQEMADLLAFLQQSS